MEDRPVLLWHIRNVHVPVLSDGAFLKADNRNGMLRIMRAINRGESVTTRGGPQQSPSAGTARVLCKHSYATFLDVLNVAMDDMTFNPGPLHTSEYAPAREKWWGENVWWLENAHWECNEDCKYIIENWHNPGVSIRVKAY